MRTVAITSAKASPGVTTTAVALGAVWPHEQAVVVVEADPFGGDLAPRFGLAGAPGLGSLATEARRSGPGLVWRHTQVLPGGLAVISAPPVPEQAQVALGLLSPDVFAQAAGAVDRLDNGAVADPCEAMVILDVGRVDVTSPSWPLLARADLVVMCARPVLAELHHLVAATDTLRRHHFDVGIVLIGDGPYSSSEIAEVAKAEVMAQLPFDRHGAGALSGTAASRRMLDRSPLLRSARTLCDAISTRLEANVPLTQPRSLGSEPTEAIS